jgi:hypothetical protein
MDVIAHAGVLVDGVDDVLAEVARVRRGETHAADTGDAGGGDEQFGECHGARRGIAIGIDGLAEELEFGVAERGELADFAKDRVAGAAALGAARIGDDAVGAGLVTAFDDGEVGAEGIIAAGDFSLEGFIGVDVETHDAAVAGFDLREQVRQLAVAGGAADERDPGGALEDFFAFLLGNAAEDADDFAGAGGAAVESQAGEYFLRSFFADAAGVVEDDVGGLWVVDGRVAASEKDASNFFGVVRVHLAAEGFDVERLASGNGRQPANNGRDASKRFETDVRDVGHGMKRV